MGNRGIGPAQAVRASLFLAFVACSCGPAQVSTRERSAGPAHERSTCPVRSYDEWNLEAMRLAFRLPRAARGPACRSNVEAALGALTSSMSGTPAEIDAGTTSPQESCAALGQRYVASCVGMKGCGSNDCINSYNEFYRRRCAEEAASAAWRATFEERARTSIGELESLDLVREEVVVAVNCVDAVATSDPAWQRLEARLSELATQQPGPIPRASHQCGCSLQEITVCGVDAWLRALQCEPPRPSAVHCACSAGDLMCNMQCSNR
jgi:hypothetical protein